MPEWDSGWGRTDGHLHWLPINAVHPLLGSFGRIMVDVPRSDGPTTRRERFSWAAGGGIGSLIEHQGRFSILGAPFWFKVVAFYSNHCLEDCENAANSWNAYMEGNGLCTLQNRGRGLRYDPFFQQIQSESVFHSEMVRQTAAEVVGEVEAHTRLAAANRLLVPGLRQGCARGDLRGKERLARPDARESRRNQGTDYRAGRRSLDGERMPNPR